MQKVAPHLRQKRIGHCGTLDPDATGLLLLTLGQATRLTRFLIHAPKVYEGDDHASGSPPTPTTPRAARSPSGRPTGSTRRRSTRRCRRFDGTFEQRLPAYCAHKIQGVKLYELARRGEEVPDANKDGHRRTSSPASPTSTDEPDRVPPHLHARAPTPAAWPTSSAPRSACGGHLSALRRTADRQARLWFDVADALTLAEANRRNAARSDARAAWMPLDPHPPAVRRRPRSTPQQERRRSTARPSCSAPRAAPRATGCGWSTGVGELVAVGIGGRDARALRCRRRSSPGSSSSAGPDVVGFSRI